MTQAAEQAVEHADCIGLTLGNVKIVSELGRGGMGTVYRAEHTVLQTPYAVKVLHPELSKDAVLNERFRREAVVCSKLRHPNIVFLTDFGYNEDIGLYIVMEFLEGVPLLNLMHQKKLTLWEVIEISRQVCGALSAAHEHQVLHRDLKPENIFLVKTSSSLPQVKVLDFGIARLIDDNGPRLTEQGMVMGTPEYLAPEHIQGGHDAGPAADLYSLGLIMYEMLAYTLPFQSEDSMQLFYQHVTAQPDPVSDHRPPLASTQLNDLIMQMLAKLPLERPASAEAVEAQLASALKELQDRGMEEAFPPQKKELIQDTDRQPSTKTSQYKLSGVIELLQQPTQETSLSRFFQLLPGLSKLPPDLFFSVSWGLLLQDLRESEPGSDVFEESLLYLIKLLDDLLENTDEEEQETISQLVGRAVGDLEKILDPEHQKPVLEALQGLSSHPGIAKLFSGDGNSGWSFKGILKRDVRNFFRK